MSKKKPSWQKTTQSWKNRKAIWWRWALGETEKDTKVFLELHADEYENAPIDRSTINKVRKELIDMPIELVQQLIAEMPAVKTLVIQQRPDIETEITNTLESYQNTGKLRDCEVFNKSNQIISESIFRNIIQFLCNTCIRKSQMNRIFEFINFFDMEANKYIDIHLKHSCYQLCVKLQKLFDLIEISNVEYLWYLRLIEEGKIEDKWHHFDAMPVDESDEEYLHFPDSGIRGEEELYLLLPNPSAYLFFDVRFPEPGFPQSDSRYGDWKQELDKLITDCDSSYSAYRSSVKDILYL